MFNPGPVSSSLFSVTTIGMPQFVLRFGIRADNRNAFRLYSETLETKNSERLKIQVPTILHAFGR